MNFGWKKVHFSFFNLPVFYFIVFLPLSLCQSVCGQGLDITENTEYEQRTNIEEFKRQMKLSGKAEDRDVRVEHLRKALACRPNNPDNIKIEYRIGTELSCRWDPEHPEPLNRDQAVGVYEHILQKYNHMDYYSSRPVITSDSPQFVIPEAAIHLEGLYRGLYNDNAKGMQVLEYAMKCMQQTCKKRVSDWLANPSSTLAF